MTGARNDFEPRAGNFPRHVPARRDERLVAVADYHQRRHAERRQGIDDRCIALREHAASRQREPAPRAGAAPRLAALPAAPSENLAAAPLELRRAIVPATG